jgi:hypothetical protein
MSQPIYKLCLIRGFTEAFYQLSDEEKKTLFENHAKAMQGTGMEVFGPRFDCKWSNDKYSGFFIVKYPDIEGAIADAAGTEKVGLYRYLVSETILGIEAKR